MADRSGSAHAPDHGAPFLMASGGERSPPSVSGRSRPRRAESRTGRATTRGWRSPRARRALGPLPPGRSRARRPASRRGPAARARRQRRAQRIEAVGARHQRRHGLEPDIAFAKMRIAGGDIRRVAGDQSKGSRRRQRTNQSPRTNRTFAICEASRIFASDGQRRFRAVRRDDGRPRALMRDRERDGARCRCRDRARGRRDQAASLRNADSTSVSVSGRGMSTDDRRSATSPRTRAARSGRRPARRHAAPRELEERSASARASASVACATSQARSRSQHGREQHLRVDRREARLRERAAHGERIGIQCGCGRGPWSGARLSLAPHGPPRRFAHRLEHAHRATVVMAPSDIGQADLLQHALRAPLSGCVTPMIRCSPRSSKP